MKGKVFLFSEICQYGLHHQITLSCGLDMYQNIWKAGLMCLSFSFNLVLVTPYIHQFCHHVCLSLTQEQLTYVFSNKHLKTTEGLTC